MQPLNPKGWLLFTVENRWKCCFYSRLPSTDPYLLLIYWEKTYKTAAIKVEYLKQTKKYGGVLKFWVSECNPVFLMILCASFNFPGSLVWQLKHKVFQALDSLHAFCTEPASRQKGENKQRIRTFLWPPKLLSPAKVCQLCQALQHCTEVFLSCFNLLQLLLRENTPKDHFWS